MPTKKIPPKDISVADLLSKAGKTFDRDSYSNHIQVVITANELFIDFFYISPVVGKSTPTMDHVQRIIIPVSLAKGLTTALANVVASHETEHDTILPNSREPDPDDKITIWP